MKTIDEIMAELELKYPEDVAEARAEIRVNPLCWESVHETDITGIMLCMEINNLRATISRLREYAEHTTGCDSWAWPGGMKKPHAKCDCGYDDLMAELEESK